MKLFRKSPVKNDEVLQKNVRADHGKEICLLADCKTRWNSLLTMLRRFYDLRTAVQKSLLDLKTKDKIRFSDDELVTIKDMIDALEPVLASVELLCRKDCTIYEADVGLQFMLEQLSEQTSGIAKQLLESLIGRISERRFVYADLFAFMSDRSVRDTMTNDFGVFFKTSRTALIKQSIEILRRLIDFEDPGINSEAERMVDIYIYLMI